MHVAVETEAELIGQQQQAQRIAEPPVELAVDAGQHRGLPESEVQPARHLNAQPVGEEVAVHPVAEPNPSSRSGRASA